MKKYAWIFVLITFATSCGEEKTLDQLKAEKIAIEAQITEMEKAAAGTTGGRRIQTVSFEEVQPSVFKHFIDVQGQVDAENNVAVTAKMPGVLTSVLVKNGAYVKKGQTLARLDNDVMESSIVELETQLATATDLFNRQKSLWDQKIGTEVQFIQARTQVESIQKRIETTRVQMRSASITAPISGTVDMVNLKVGQAISPGFPLCQIVNLGDLKIKANVPEAYIALVKKGAVVNVFFPDLDKELTSKVTYVGKTINPMNRTFQVECSLPNRSTFRPNLIAVLRITDYKNNKALVVPMNVIQTDGTGSFVLLADKKEGKKALVRKSKVVKGKSYNGKIEITSGLNAGDNIITTGWQDVNPNETVAF